MITWVKIRRKKISIRPWYFRNVPASLEDSKTTYCVGKRLSKHKNSKRDLKRNRNKRLRSCKRLQGYWARKVLLEAFEWSALYFKRHASCYIEEKWKWARKKVWMAIILFMSWNKRVHNSGDISSERILDILWRIRQRKKLWSNWGEQQRQLT